jgi:hypothetical protein
MFERCGAAYLSRPEIRNLCLRRPLTSELKGDHTFTR